MRSKIFPENPVKSRDCVNVERVDNVDKRTGKSYGNRRKSGKAGKMRKSSQRGKICYVNLKIHIQIGKSYPV